MKRLTLFVSALAVALCSFASNGDKSIKERSDSQSKIAIIQGKEVMKLVYLNEQSNRVLIKVYDEEGHKLVSTGVRSKDGFIQPFNFSEVDEGNYTFEITDDSGTIIENVTLDRSEVSISTVYKIKDTQKFRVNVLAENDDVEIRIMDEDMNILHRDSFNEADSFSRVYDLASYKGKGLYITVKSGKDEDTHYSEGS